MRKKALAISQGIYRKEPNYVFYWLRFLIGLSFGLISPVYALLLFSKGLNAFQVGMINLVFVLGNIFFNLPAGALADVWGRKKAFLISTVFNASSFLLYGLGQSWPIYAVSEFLAALGFVLMIGVLEAWVTDSWKEQTQSEEFGFLFSRAETANYSASMIGGLLGGFLGRYFLQLPFLIGAATNILVLPMAYFLMQENWSVKKVNLKKIALDSIKKAQEGIKESLNNPAIFKVSLFIFISTIGFKAIDIFWSKRFVDLGGGRTEIAGLLWPVMTIFMILGNLFLKKWTDNKKDYQKIFMFVGSWAGLIICLSTILPHFYLATPIFVFYEMSRGITRPVYFGYLNKIIPSNKRATILAFNSAAAWLGGAVGLLTLGWVAKTFSIETAWLGASIIFFLALIPIIKLKKV